MNRQSIKDQLEHTFKLKQVTEYDISDYEEGNLEYITLEMPLEHTQYDKLDIFLLMDTIKETLGGFEFKLQSINFHYLDDSELSSITVQFMKQGKGEYFQETEANDSLELSPKVAEYWIGKEVTLGKNSLPSEFKGDWDDEFDSEAQFNIKVAPYIVGGKTVKIIGLEFTEESAESAYYYLELANGYKTEWAWQFDELPKEFRDAGLIDQFWG